MEHLDENQPRGSTAATERAMGFLILFVALAFATQQWLLPPDIADLVQRFLRF